MPPRGKLKPRTKVKPWVIAVGVGGLVLAWWYLKGQGSSASTTDPNTSADPNYTGGGQMYIPGPQGPSGGIVTSDPSGWSVARQNRFNAKVAQQLRRRQPPPRRRRR